MYLLFKLLHVASVIAFLGNITTKRKPILLPIIEDCACVKPDIAKGATPR